MDHFSNFLFFLKFVTNLANVFTPSRGGAGQLYLVENTKEIVRPLGSWSQSGIRTDKRVVSKGSFVNVVERADLLVSRVFPRDN